MYILYVLCTIWSTNRSYALMQSRCSVYDNGTPEKFWSSKYVNKQDAVLWPIAVYPYLITSFGGKKWIGLLQMHLTSWNEMGRTTSGCSQLKKNVSFICMFWPGEYETLKWVYFAIRFSDQGWSNHIVEATVMPWISFTHISDLKFENFL